MSTRDRAPLLAACVLSLFACGATPPTGPQTPDIPLPAPADAPAGSAGHSLVYSDAHQMVLLVNAGLGGMTKPAASTPTRVWGWNGSEWTALDVAGPPIRNLAGVAYDSRRRVLVMHGGSYDLGVSYAETWEWSAAGWRRFTGAGPGVRDHTQLAFDADRGKAVLFGGSGENPNLAFNDTWEFDGAAWQQVSAAGPSARVHHAMQYDPGSRRVVVFGGITPGGGDLGDTWAWDGSTWTAAGSPSSSRTHARMAFHRGLNALVVAGGFSGSGLGLLIRSGSGWTPFPSSPEPSPRYLTGMAYDARRNVLVLFGGGDPAGTSLFADTWEFDGALWRRIRER